MSKYVEEIIRSLKENPEKWYSHGRSAISTDDIDLTDYGNSRVLSVIDLSIKGKKMPTTYRDSWALEVAVKKWFAQSSLKMQLVNPAKKGVENER